VWINYDRALTNPKKMLLCALNIYPISMSFRALSLLPLIAACAKSPAPVEPMRESTPSTVIAQKEMFQTAIVDALSSSPTHSIQDGACTLTDLGDAVEVDCNQ